MQIDIYAWIKAFKCLYPWSAMHTASNKSQLRVEEHSCTVIAPMQMQISAIINS